jgi:twitching motility protein PilT
VLDSLERLSRLFEVAEREGIFQLLSQQLIGIVCQKLVPATAEGRALVVEHFENQAVTRKWMSEGKFRELADFIAKGDNPNNVTFLQTLVAMIQSGRITEATGLQAATNPRELQRRLRGVDSSSILG